MASSNAAIPVNMNACEKKDTFVGMFRYMSNCLGGIAVSTIVAKSEKEIDMDVYHS